MRRIILIILDGVGVGALPDAAQFGDTGADTLGHVAGYAGGLNAPNLASLGLGNIHTIAGVAKQSASRGWFGKMNEVSPGKDSTAGHWEICGTIIDVAFKTFPNGFPAAIMDEFLRRTGCRGYYGNKSASGTGIIDEFGAQHLQTGYPIIYTSADSVFQIAAHESVIPIDQLYKICEQAYEMLLPHQVGRVIARPFKGNVGAFERTEFRKDYSVPPPPGTLLDLLQHNSRAVYGVGKVDNLFAGRGFTSCQHTKDNQHGVTEILKLMEATQDQQQECLIFANLVDFDTVYGHRNDPAGFAKAIEQFDQQLPRIFAALQPQDLLVITADHGNDPTHPGTDHTREYVPLLVTRKACLTHATGQLERNLGIRASYADVGATIADYFSINGLKNGKSFLRDILNS